MTQPSVSGFHALAGYNAKSSQGGWQRAWSRCSVGHRFPVLITVAAGHCHPLQGFINKNASLTWGLSFKGKAKRRRRRQNEIWVEGKGKILLLAWKDSAVCTCALRTLTILFLDQLQRYLHQLTAPSGRTIKSASSAEGVWPSDPVPQNG